MITDWLTSLFSLLYCVNISNRKCTLNKKKNRRFARLIIGAWKLKCDIDYKIGLIMLIPFEMTTKKTTACKVLRKSLCLPSSRPFIQSQWNIDSMWFMHISGDVLLCKCKTLKIEKIECFSRKKTSTNSSNKVCMFRNVTPIIWFHM